ncbi:putative acrylyl-CoA reductase AcuI [compost metagenome]
MPFILRNVRLQGVDSVMTPAARRAQAWERLVQDLPESFYAQSATQISLEQAPEFAAKIVNNQIQGRTLVKIA